MSAVFESQSLGPTERLIMLALADHADDDGRCYPSIERLCQRTGLSERAVQSNIRKLTKGGYVRVNRGGGKGNANLYFISANPAGNAPYEAQNPARSAPYQTPQEMHPAGDAPQTPQQVRPNPAGDAPEPSGTVIGTVTEAADAHARTHAREAGKPEDLIWSILHAIGFDRGQTIPRYWMAPDAPLIVARWRTDLGLTEDEIQQVARQNAIQFGQPANGPKILTRHMQDFAAAKTAPPMSPTTTTTPHPRGQRHDRAAFDTALHAALSAAPAGADLIDRRSRDPLAGR